MPIDYVIYIYFYTCLNFYRANFSKNVPERKTKGLLAFVSDEFSTGIMAEIIANLSPVQGPSLVDM